MSIHYAPGPAFALVRPGAVVLVDACVGTAVAADLWEAVDAARAPGTSTATPGGWDLATLLDTVTEVLDPTWRALPSFAVVVLGAGDAAGATDGASANLGVTPVPAAPAIPAVVQVAVRGAFSAVVTTRAADRAPGGAPQEATEKVSGPDVTTWVDKTIGDVVRMELVTGADADAAPLLVIVDGIVQAERLRWDVVDGLGEAAVAGDDGAGAGAADGLSGPESDAPGISAAEAHADADAKADPAVGYGARSLASAVPARAPVPAHAMSPSHAPSATGDGLTPAHHGETDFGRTLASVPEEWEHEAEEHDEDDFDDTTFFASALAEIKASTSSGATTAAPELAAASATSTESPAPHAAPAPTPAPAPAAPSPAPPVPATTTGAIPPPPPPPPTSAVVHVPPVLPQAQQVAVTVAPFRDPAPQGTTILARSCFFGHPNPPSRLACAQCGGGLSPTAQLVERPSLGQVEISTGESVDLSVPIVVGRFPQAQATASPVAQRLVTVPSPSQDISRSHVEIRLDGWHVLLVDLDTVNGTMLLRAGQPLRRLHPSEPTLVADGDVVDLGDGITLTFRGLV